MGVLSTRIGPAAGGVLSKVDTDRHEVSTAISCCLQGTNVPVAVCTFYLFTAPNVGVSLIKPIVDNVV